MRLLLALALFATPAIAERPNVILAMTDDQGWGDTGYNGHPTLRTPHLDQMAREGVRFNRFYSASAVCSPTRASCLTGRHPARMGISGANKGRLPDEEITLAEVLREQGYRTGHFGKWHLGTLTTELKDSNRGAPGETEHYAPPWEHGFDTSFSTEAKVPTWDPMVDPETGGVYGTRYFDQTGAVVTENLDGDDSTIIMDRAVPFIREAAEQKKPFLAVIWFHAPHKPIVSGPPYTDGYEEHEEYYGCISAVDAQMGRLRKVLEESGVADNTMLWFCSDNGPENGTPGITGGFRDRKRSLHDGGVRVPGLLVWPARYPTPRVVDASASTSDYFPTILATLGLDLPQRPFDGVNLLPLIEAQSDEREAAIGFQHRVQCAWVEGRWKLYSSNGGKEYQLYDLVADPAESKDVSGEHAERVTAMTTSFDRWWNSCVASSKGADY